jgi:hypothetical protein
MTLEIERLQLVLSSLFLRQFLALGLSHSAQLGFAH